MHCRAHWLISTTTLVVLIGALGSAQATGIGTLSALSLGSFNSSGGTSAPTIITCDDFSRTASTGTALDLRPVQLPTNCGSTIAWATNLGTWSISSGELAATGKVNSTASVNAGLTDVSAEATVIGANGTSRIAGVAINHTGGTRIYLAAALSGPGTAQLLLVNGNTVSTLASATATITATTVVRITRVSTAVTVSVNGALVISFTLSAGNVTTLSGGTRTGLYWNSGTTIRFTNFLVTAASTP